MKYNFIFDNKKYFSVMRMCRIFKIKPMTYYAWKRRGPSIRSVEDDLIKDKIIEIHSDSKLKFYGSPRLCPELNEAGLSCGHNRVAKIMRQNDIRAKIGKKHKYKKQKNDVDYIVPNILDRNFNQNAPDKAWVTDITYIPTFTGWVYLCVFIDLFSKLVVGWAISKSPNTELVLKALNRAVNFRNPKKGLIVHSDRGCQYTAKVFKNYLQDHQFVQSMSRKGNCWDNACAESFFGHFKCETIFGNTFYSKEEVERTVFEYIECFFNRRRRHLSCGQLSPINFEKKYAA